MSLKMGHLKHLPGAEGPNASPSGELAEVPSGAAQMSGAAPVRTRSKENKNAYLCQDTKTEMRYETICRIISHPGNVLLLPDT